MTTRKSKFDGAKVVRTAPVNLHAKELRESLPPTVAERGSAKGRGNGRALQIVVPDETLAAVKVAAAQSDTTARSIILAALANAGFPVPADEIKDRRRG